MSDEKYRWVNRQINKKLATTVAVIIATLIVTIVLEHVLPDPWPIVALAAGFIIDAAAVGWQVVTGRYSRLEVRWDQTQRSIP